VAFRYQTGQAQVDGNRSNVPDATVIGLVLPIYVIYVDPLEIRTSACRMPNYITICKPIFTAAGIWFFMSVSSFGTPPYDTIDPNGIPNDSDDIALITNDLFVDGSFSARSYRIEPLPVYGFGPGPQGGSKYVIILHVWPEHENDTDNDQIDLNYVSGTFFALRGAENGYPRIASCTVRTAYSYKRESNARLSLESLGEGEWRFVKLQYEGITYLGLIPPYQDAHYNRGFTFAGFHSSTDELMDTDGSTYTNSLSVLVYRQWWEPTAIGLNESDFVYLETNQAKVIDTATVTITGETEFKNSVRLSQPQGDISMGVFH